MDRRLLKHITRQPYRLPLILAVGSIIGGLVLSRVSLLNALLLTVLAFAAVGGFVEPLIAVSVALFLGPMWAWLRAALPQIPPLIGQYVFFIAIAAWIARGLLRHDFRIPFPPLLWPLLMFMGVTLLSLWQPIDAWVGLWEWAKWGQILLMFLLVYDRIHEENSHSRAMTMVITLAGVGSVQAAIGVWQFALRGTGTPQFAIDERFYRAYGTFEQPNPFAGFLGMMGAVVAGLVLGWLWDWMHGKGSVVAEWQIAHHASRITFPISGFKQALFLFPTLLIYAGIAASWSRGAWMGLGAALLVMVGMLPRRGLWGLLLH